MLEFIIQVCLRGMWLDVELITAKDAVAAQREAWLKYGRRFGQVKAVFA